MVKNNLTALLALNVGRIPMGAEILAFSVKQDGGRSTGYALAWLPDNNVTPYVTWMFSGTDPETSGFCFGHYITDLGDARKDYGDRVRSMLFKD